MKVFAGPGRLASLTLLVFCWAGCSSTHGELFRRVRPPVAFELLRDNPSVRILDLRTLNGYLGPDGHLAGALCYPLDELPQHETELRYLRDSTMLIYCDTSECSEAGLAWFLAHEFKNAMLMEGGIGGWIDSGFGTVVSASVPPASDDREAIVNPEEESQTRPPLPKAE